jgi:hypothetical protein
VPQGVLDIVAEHPQEQHVGGEVENVTVQEHVCEKRVAFGHVQRIERTVRRAAKNLHLEQLVGDQRKARGGALPETAGLPDEYRHVGDDEAHRHPLKADRAQRIVVRERNEHHGFAPSAYTFRSAGAL